MPKVSVYKFESTEIRDSASSVKQAEKLGFYLDNVDSAGGLLSLSETQALVGCCVGYYHNDFRVDLEEAIGLWGAKSIGDGSVFIDIEGNNIAY